MHLFPFWHTLAHVLIHQRKIHNDLWNEITKPTILYATVHFIRQDLPLAILVGNSFFYFLVHCKKNHTYFSERDNFSSRGLVRKETTRFRNVLLVLGKWTTIKFEHCLPGCHSMWGCTDYICILTYSSAVLLQCDKAGIFINRLRPVSNVVLLPCQTQLIELNST